MNNIDYQINYNANDIFYIEIVKRCNEWSTELEAIQKAINEIVEMESFSGSSAENLKSYLSEVHSIVCVALWQLIVEFQSRFLLYKDKYYEFDSNIYSVLDFDTMKYYYDKTSELKSDLEDAGSKISSALLDICDIIDLSNPSTGTLLTNLEYINEQIDKLDNSIINHESDQVTSAMKNLNDMIYNLDIMLESYKNMNSGIKDYHAGDCLSYEAVLCLGGNIQTSMDYISENEEAINTAYERLTKTYEQMQADAEAAAADARTDTGTAEVIRGVGSVALGVFAIFASGGAATPIVVTAYVAGGCSIAYGVSNVVEGGQEIYYGLEGDLETKSFNPIRDTVFVGNQSAYDTWGKLSMAVAAITIPVGKTVTRLQTAGASGEVLAKNVAFTIGKEVVVDELSDKAVGYTTSHIVETWGLNQTQSTLVQMGLSAVATIGTGKLEDTLTESKFASQMSPDDAARYNAWSDKCQYGTPNRYPGLSETDVALWNKANVKVDEAVALSKIDAEAFAKLKKVEFKTGVVDDIAEVSRRTQRSLIESVENSSEGTKGLTNLQKGNYGEMKMDDFFESQGYDRISTDRVTDLNAPTHQGIDGIYYNPDGHPPYIIGEAKYGSSKLSTLADGTPQMSDKWIIDRLENAVGEEIANDIKMEMILNPENVGSSLVHISPEGNIDVTELIDGVKQ